MIMATACYRDLLTIAANLRKQGYLRSFKGDLVRHDKARFKNYCGPYLWAIREGGTHLLTPEGACFGKNHGGAWDSLASGQVFGSEKTKIFYSADGGKPRPVKGAVPGAIARKWETACKAPKSMWDPSGVMGEAKRHRRIKKRR